jgi:hypothetical protein
LRLAHTLVDGFADAATRALNQHCYLVDPSSCSLEEHVAKAKGAAKAAPGDGKSVAAVPGGGSGGVCWQGGAKGKKNFDKKT